MSYYIPGEAEGAYPNGTRIEKVWAEEGDGTAIGVGGEVIASHYVGDAKLENVPYPVTYFYFVVFDDFPSPVGIVDRKIGRESE